MKRITIFFALFLANLCIAQEPHSKPLLSLAAAAQIAQETLEANRLAADFYLNAIQLTTRQSKPSETIYEARFEPSVQSETKPTGTPSVIRYRVIVVDMLGKGTIEAREVTPGTIRRRIIQSSNTPES